MILNNLLTIKFYNNVLDRHNFTNFLTAAVPYVLYIHINYLLYKINIISFALQIWVFSIIDYEY